MRLVTFGGLKLEGASSTRMKPLLLLAYLALEGPRDRRQVAELFWMDAADPLNSLSAALGRLRKVPGIVEADNRQVWSTVECDAKEFLAASEAGRFEEALALYQGPFLSGVYLSGWSAELEEWVYGTREVLAGRLRDALLRLGEQEAARGEFEEAARHAQAACLLRGAIEPEPSELRRLYTLLRAGEHPQALEVRQEAHASGIALELSTEEARTKLLKPAKLATIPHNLPLRATSFIGRDLERAELGKLLEEHRLISLVGLAGVGKTRLALQVAREALEQRSFSGGIYFIALDPLTSPVFIPTSIAEGLSLGLEGSEDPLKQVIRHIGGKHILLVLDNYEHLMDGAVLASELLKSCPNLKLLVTSRERLNLEEELVVSLEGLLYPESSLPESVNWGDFDALELFVERARRARPGFALSQEDQRHVIQICRLLEGAPLGIELAAAWVRLMPCSEIAEEIEKSMDFLATSMRNAPDRHKSIRATFEHSWKLLTPKEQEVLRKLSVFRGGFRREAAAEVAGATIPVLASLLDKSLLRVTNGRYDRHPLLYQYAQEKLSEHPEEEAQTRGRHVSYFLALAEEAEPHLAGVQEAAWLERLEVEHDNLRVALEWAETNGEVEMSLRLAGSLLRFWFVRGYLSEGRMWLTRALLQRETARTAARAKALNGAGVLACHQGDLAPARSFHEESLAIRRELEDKQGIADSLNNLGIIAWQQGDYNLARSLHEESLSLRRELGDKQGVIMSLNNLGMVAHDQGDYTSARSLYEEALALGRELGDRMGIAGSLNDLGAVAYDQGDYASARSLYEESLEICRELGNKWAMAHLFFNLGEVARDQGDYTLARLRHRESLALLLEMGYKRIIADSLEAFAALSVGEGEAKRAAHLYGAAQALREVIGAPLPPNDRPRYERNMAAARTQLGEEAFSAAWAEGQAMMLDEAIRYALGT